MINLNTFVPVLVLIYWGTLPEYFICQKITICATVQMEALSNIYNIQQCFFVFVVTMYNPAFSLFCVFFFSVFGMDFCKTGTPSGDEIKLRSYIKGTTQRGWLQQWFMLTRTSRGWSLKSSALWQFTKNGVGLLGYDVAYCCSPVQ